MADEKPEKQLDTAQRKLLLAIAARCDEQGMLSSDGAAAIYAETVSDPGPLTYLLNRELVNADRFAGAAFRLHGLTPKGQRLAAELSQASEKR